jgi:hypothetical protein
MESIWNSPHGFHGQFPWIPSGMGLHSKKLPSPLWIPWTGFHGIHLESTWNPPGIRMESTWNRYLELIKWNLIYIYIIAYINYNTNTVIKHIYEGVKGVGEGERDSPGGGGGLRSPGMAFERRGAFVQRGWAFARQMGMVWGRYPPRRCCRCPCLFVATAAAVAVIPPCRHCRYPPLLPLSLSPRHCCCVPAAAIIVHPRVLMRVGGPWYAGSGLTWRLWQRPHSRCGC